jgi:hypothetical protein
MSTPIITVRHIEMYCAMLREKMWKKIQEAQVGDNISLAAIKKDIHKKYGIDKLDKKVSKLKIKREKDYQKLGEKIDNIYKEIRNTLTDNKIDAQILERYKLVSYSDVLKEQMRDFEEQIKLSTCPDDIKEIFKKLDK